MTKADGEAKNRREMRACFLQGNFSRSELIAVYDAAQTSVCNTYADKDVESGVVEGMSHGHAINCVKSYIETHCIIRGLGVEARGLTHGEVDLYFSEIH